MSLRINQNTASLKANRYLSKNLSAANKSLEKLSSGLAINTAGDAPATLVASEQMRGQIASIDQAIKNTETSVSMVQTAEGALSEVNNMLVAMRSLAIHAANEGANDAVMLDADQMEISSMVEAVDRIAKSTQFGAKKLLDGSNGVNGKAVGEGLEFVSATAKTKGTGGVEYDVNILEEATKSSLTSTTAFTQEMLDEEEVLLVSEGGRTATYKTSSVDTVESAISNFATEAKNAGLAVDISVNEAGIVEISHQKKGSEYYFEVSSSSKGLLSEESVGYNRIQNGDDVSATINGEATIGKGEIMTGLVGNSTTEGLTLRYKGMDNGLETPEGASVGIVTVAQNALNFQVGANAGDRVTVALQDLSANQLGRGVDQMSGFQSLRDVDVTSSQGAQDSLLMIDKAINDVTQARAKLGSVQKNTLESNIATLKVTAENMTAAESAIRDTDMAKEMAEYTRSNLLTQSAAAMTGHANQLPQRVFNLIKD